MNRLSAPIVPALAFALAASALAATPVPKGPEMSTDLLPFQATEKTLPNGLRVIVVPTGFPNLVSLQIPVQTGSRNEVEPGKSGFAHFFEHMMFRGTKAYPPAAYQAILTKAGARQNAYTTDDYTNYHTTFAKEDLEKVLEIEADRFQNLDYPEAAFKTESRAVLGEYNKNSANPMSKLFEAMRDTAFTKHTYKHTTMGFLRDIEDMPNQFAYSKAFFDRWYRPEYTTVIVAGDVDPAKVLPLVEKYWGSWKRGSYSVEIPVEPPPSGPKTVHVPWTTPTLPWVAVAFRGPAFSTTEKDWAALDVLLDLAFGPTSDAYKKLVETEQKVDQLFPYLPSSADPQLLVAGARVKKLEDAVAVRDEILRTFATLRVEPVPARRLADAKSNARYGIVRGLDNTDAIGGILARFVRFRREYGTLNEIFRVYATLTPEDLRAAAAKYFTDAGLVLTTLSHEAPPPALAQLPALATLAPATAAPAGLAVVERPSPLPQVSFKLLFAAGSAHDPKGKEGLATLTASMVAEAGSKDAGIDEIRKALFPMAAGFSAGVDKEMTVFTGSVHRDNGGAFLDIVLPQLLAPGFREEDFRRLKDAQKNALAQDLIANNEEELGKERLQAVVFAGTPYAHPSLGTLAGIEAITLDDVKSFWKAAYTRAALTVGLAGDVPADLKARLLSRLGGLPEGPALPAPAGVAGRAPQDLEVEIVQKETRATAISFGLPIAVTRSHPDFAALSVARAHLGEHRSSMSHLYQRIRELRGMNYGDYAYIEAFPGGMYRFFPEPNVARRAQLFEVWIRPVVPASGPMALKIALHELDGLIREGISEADFQATRDYLMKNVYLLTSTQGQDLGTALDSRWYGTGDYVPHMRERLAKLTRAEVNKAIRRHLSAEKLSVVFITKDAEGLKKQLLSSEPATIAYDAPKPPEVLAEDKIIGARKLGLTTERIRVTPVADVFAR
ncbi:MAG: insulinase family protein [Holophagales bacterium]|nr:insulinase family protein [Holophagales bacterium]